MSAAAPAHRLSVLLVEDRADVSETLRTYLEACCDFRVRIAPDGDAAVRAAVADPPDAVLLDIGLPRKDGFQVAAELTARLPRRPLLVAITGYGGPDVEARARAAGFDHYLLKPADPHAVEALLRAHAASRAG